MRTHALLIMGLLILTILCTGCDEIISEILAGDAELDKAARSGDPNNCAELDTSKDSSRVFDCLGEMARYEKKEGICELIMKGYNKDECIKKVAIAKGDAKLCNTLSGNTDPCIKEVAVKLKDRSYCDELSNKDLKNTCLMDVAIAQGNAQYCRDIVDAYTRRSCLNEYAIQYVSVKYCDETEGMRDNCVTQIALKKGSPDDCLKLSTGLGDCVYSVAEREDDASICEAITSIGTRDKCVHNVAVSAHDTAVCDNIKDVGLKNSCIKSTTLDIIQK